ncbi:hypothetical protein HanOQP8_Chr16g0626811 [Helianthus annuus]|nr:hypothetical protein HanOQP8_Chr16g0626811 [Helianthus annuus]
MLLIFSPKPLNIAAEAGLNIVDFITCWQFIGAHLSIYLSGMNGSDHDTDMMADVGSDQEDHSVAENIAKHIEVADNYDIGEYE